MNKTITVRDDDAKVVEEKFARIARRATKLGLPVPTLTEIERKIEVIGDRSEKVVIFEVVGQVPRVDGWEFVASLHHIDGGNIAIGAACDVPEKYKDVGPDCDHCGLKRARRDTYLLRSEQNEWKQVGRSCLGDFLRSDFHLAVYGCQVIEDLEELALAYGGRVGIAAGYDLQTYLTWVAATIREKSWISGKEAFMYAQVDPTWQTAREAMHEMQRWQENEAKEPKDRSLLLMPSIEITVQDAIRAYGAIEWASALEPLESEDYLWNLRAISKARIIDHRLMGLAASMITAEESARERALNAERAAASEHFGVVGERAVYTLTVERTKEIETAWGPSLLILLRDQNGNAAKWFKTGADEKEFTEGATLQVKATVKAHDEYQGTKQTSLTRVAIYVPKEPKRKKTVSNG